MKYELWFSANENSYELVPENGDPVLATIRSTDSVRVAVFEAESWDEARRMKSQYLGFDREDSGAA